MKIDAEKLAYWIDDNVGQSSVALFLYMARGDVPHPFSAPSDSSDRARCAALLNAVPEWVPRLKEIEDLHVKGKRYSSENIFLGADVEPWNDAIPLIRKELDFTS